MKKAQCYICDSSNLSEVFTLRNYPAYIVPIPKNISKTVVSDSLTLSSCSNCGHMQVCNPDREVQRLIYEEYYSHYVVDSSESFIPHYREPFIDFFKSLQQKSLLSNKNTLLEIGCSSGKQRDFFKSFVSSYTGIDPSERIELAMEEFPQENFIKGYFPQALPGLFFDVIVSQFNLEHIKDVKGFLGVIHTKLNEDGLVVLQVPDVEDFVKSKQPNFMAHEHIQYFTKKSLDNLLNVTGFEVVEWGKSGPSLIVAGKKSEPISTNFAHGLEEALSKTKNQEKLFYNQPTLIPEKVIYYGVGPQLYWLLKDKKDISRAMIIDDNTKYHGQALPYYGNEIIAPSLEVVKKCNEIVLSLNRIYHDAVIEKLKLFDVPLVIHKIGNEGVWEKVQL